MSSSIKISALFIFCIHLYSFEGFSQKSEVDKINQLLDDWHKAAAGADEDAFFGSMTEDCIYIGTDETEKWKRDELRKWSEEFFQRESAWSFEPYDREVYLKNDVAWFDEKLKTWMGICRASGVLQRTNEGWKLKHYQLSVTIPNDKIKAFIELVEAQ